MESSGILENQRSSDQQEHYCVKKDMNDPEEKYEQYKKYLPVVCL